MEVVAKNRGSMNISTLHLNAIVTKSLVDEEFRAKILNGQRAACLDRFRLSDQHRKAVLAIKTDNVNDFIAQIHVLIQSDLPSQI